MAKNLDDVYEQIFRLAGAQENMNLRLEELGGAVRGLHGDVRGLSVRMDTFEGKTTTEDVVREAVKEVTGKFKIPSSEQPPTVDKVATALEKREQQKRRERRNAIAQWVGIAVGLIMILTTLGGVLAYVSRLSRKLDAQPDEMRSLIAAQGQRVVYVHVPQQVDAGTEPVPLPPKRPKKVR